MAESGLGKFNSDKDILKETLFTIGDLYNELEAEREASYSATSEAMAVILRLQGEKAAVQMEAEQYKRLAEEKICYVEESLSIFENIMYEKQMEVLGLEHRVQAYRDKLISMGCDDLDLDDENGGGETSLKTLPRRNSSSVEEHIRMLDRRVKEMAEASYANTRNCTTSHTPITFRTRSPSPFPTKEAPEVSPSLLDSKLKEIVHAKSNGNGHSKMQNEHDVFEIPQVDRRNPRKRATPGEFHKPDFIEEIVKPSNRDDEIEADCNLAVLPPRSKPSDAQPLFLQRTSYTMPCPPLMFLFGKF